ncbi:MAG TPA: hypothetical protein VFG32_10495 [Bacteroidota bacterium]|nr:hypothetical protein [Bacteroidota bacterium]
MSVILDLIWSTLIAAFVILLGLRLNASIAGSADASKASLNVQESLVDIVQTIEYDFRKIAYRIADPSAAIIVADSSRLTFLSDIDNNGTIDTVSWYAGPKLTSMANPNIRGLFRSVSGEGAVAAPGLGVTEFHLKYLDQDGVEISSSYPLPIADLRRIWIIETTMMIESPYKVQDQLNPEMSYADMGYAAAFWRQTRLASRNIRRHG